ncbi:MAG: tRNA pseudouridine(38-40) synthase TruA [Acidobacteriia bacterium]|nr:tRNA pseudouridine(38-40) synthase TruA [Terriglobia bacterium]
MRNIRLVIAYDGTDFQGWQRQPRLPTIQECLETAVERLTGETLHVWGSGRTDAGVHALNQVANFKTSSPIPCENLVKALNNLLPPTVRVKQAQEVSASFHARYDVRAKTYRYRILQAPVCSPFLWRFVWHYPFPLDVDRMEEAARVFLGEHDFTSFAAAGCEAGEKPRSKGDAGGDVQEELGIQNSESRIQRLNADKAKSLQPRGRGGSADRAGGREMVRNIVVSRLVRCLRASMLIYEVTGNGFLHHMVRNMVGTLMEVGRGKLAPRDVERILAARDRTLAGPTAPAQGLCLVKVDY